LAIAVFTNGEHGMRIVEGIVKAATGRDHAVLLWL
jgi:hypothetical protein